MGSDTKRKQNDRVRIDQPIAEDVFKNTEGGGIGSAPVDSNNVCPVSFRVKLAVQNLPVGTKLVVQDGSIRTGMHPDIEVGRLTQRIADRIKRCSALDIVYIAEVAADKKGVRYANFSQA